MLKCRVLAIIFFSAFIWEISRANKQAAVPFSKLATCQEYVIDNFACKHFFPVEIFKNSAKNDEVLRLQFYAMSHHDANILVNSQKDWNNITEFVVGGWDNTKSVLRVHGDNEVDVSTFEGVVDPLFPTPIEVVQWRNGTIEISIPGVIKPLLRGHLPDLKINYVCLQGFHKTNRWFYNCLEEQVIFADWDEKSHKKCFDSDKASSEEDNRKTTTTKPNKVQIVEDSISEKSTESLTEATTTRTSFVDDAQALGNLAASAIRNLKTEEYKRLLKRKIQTVILELEKLDDAALNRLNHPTVA